MALLEASSKEGAYAPSLEDNIRRRINGTLMRELPITIKAAAIAKVADACTIAVMAELEKK